MAPINKRRCNESKRLTDLIVKGKSETKPFALAGVGKKKVEHGMMMSMRWCGLDWGRADRETQSQRSDICIDMKSIIHRQIRREPGWGCGGAKTPNCGPVCAKNWKKAPLRWWRRFVNDRRPKITWPVDRFVQLSQNIPQRET